MTNQPDERKNQSLLTKASSLINGVFTFIRVRQVGIMLTLMMMFLCFVMLSWGVAFWCNGLFETHFDLGSCWQGITVVATGLVTVAGFAAMPYVRYFISSKWNSNSGEPPGDDPFNSK